jgi:NADH dehydrogenase FAD-containing subunit
MASVRAIVPGQFPDDKVFQAIAPGFEHYPAGSFEFVVGTAESVDVSNKSVSIATASGARTQAYDILVVATGSRTIGKVPWKANSSYEQTRDDLHEIQQKVKNAKSIIVGGAGPTGVETAAELGFEFGSKKQITLATAGEELLKGSLPSNIAKGAEKQLENLHVKILRNAKIMDSRPTSDGRTELSLANGENLITDLYLPTIGVVPNTEFLPKNLLNSKGDLIVNQYLRVKNAKDVWAAGDVIDVQRSQFVLTQKQAAALSKNLDLVLKGKEPVVYKTDGADMLAVTLGRSKGTGAFGTWKVPSFVVYMAKGKTMGTQHMGGYINGSAF